MENLVKAMEAVGWSPRMIQLAKKFCHSPEDCRRFVEDTIEKKEKMGSPVSEEDRRMLHAGIDRDVRAQTKLETL